MTVVVPILNFVPDLWLLSTTTTPQLPSEKMGDCQVTTAESVFVKTVIGVVKQPDTVGGV